MVFRAPWRDQLHMPGRTWSAWGSGCRRYSRWPLRRGAALRGRPRAMRCRHVGHPVERVKHAEEVDAVAEAASLTNPLTTLSGGSCVYPTVVPRRPRSSILKQNIGNLLLEAGRGRSHGSSPSRTASPYLKQGAAPHLDRENPGARAGRRHRPRRSMSRDCARGWPAATGGHQRNVVSVSSKGTWSSAPSARERLGTHCQEFLAKAGRRRRPGLGAGRMRARV